jgi:hypothetical protein
MVLLFVDTFDHSANKHRLTAATMSNHESVQTPSVRSVFDNDDDKDDRQSLSSADVSAEGALEDALEQTPQAVSRAAKQLYATPQTRSIGSSIGAPAREKLEMVSPGGRRCIVTNEAFPRAAVEAAHLLPRAADHDLVQLSFRVISCLIHSTLFS